MMNASSFFSGLRGYDMDLLFEDVTVSHENGYIAELFGKYSTSTVVCQKFSCPIIAGTVTQDGYHNAGTYDTSRVTELLENCCTIRGRNLRVCRAHRVCQGFSLVENYSIGRSGSE